MKRTKSLTVEVTAATSSNGHHAVHLGFNRPLLKGLRRQLTPGAYTPSRDEHPVIQTVVLALLGSELPLQGLTLHPLQTRSEILVVLERPLTEDEQKCVTDMLEDARRTAGWGGPAISWPQLPAAVS